MVIAIIQPTKLDAVRAALEKLEVSRMTISDAQGFGQQGGKTAVYRGNQYTVRMLRKVTIEVVVNDDFVERTVEVLTNIARTGPEGTIGDGKIFIMPTEETIRISDGVRGPGAV